MNAKYIISRIDKLRADWYNPPKKYYGIKKVEFEYESYKCHALNEIKMFLSKCEETDPITAIENFRRMMGEFACRKGFGDVNFMFSVYYDVATDVLDSLL